MLKSREPNLSSLAARGIDEIGDPKGEAIPYLIESLVFQTKEVVASTPGQITLGYYYNPNPLQPPIVPQYRMSGVGSRIPQPMGLPSAPQPMGISTPAQPMGGGQSFGMGASFPPYTTSIQIGSVHWPPNVNIKGPGEWYYTPPSAGVARRDNLNPAVHDALVKLANQDFGANRDQWRRWWAAEKKDREAQATSARDRVLPKTPERP